MYFVVEATKNQLRQGLDTEDGPLYYRINSLHSFAHFPQGPALITGPIDIHNSRYWIVAGPHSIEPALESRATSVADGKVAYRTSSQLRDWCEANLDLLYNKNGNPVGFKAPIICGMAHQGSYLDGEDIDEAEEF